MHPSCALIIWLAAVVAGQKLDFYGLGFLIAVALAWAPAGIRPWLAYIGRARWLFLALWLIVAFQTPGEAVFDVDWAPTHEGLAEANRHALRLLAVLAWLAWLFASCGRGGIVNGLWGLMLPVNGCGIAGQRLLVRLALVLEHLEKPLDKGAWRHMLADEGRSFPGPASLILRIQPWSSRDYLVALLAAFGMVWVMLQ